METTKHLKSCKLYANITDLWYFWSHGLNMWMNNYQHEYKDFILNQVFLYINAWNNYYTNYYNKWPIHLIWLFSPVFFLKRLINSSDCGGFLLELPFRFLFWGILFLVPLLYLYCKFVSNKADAVIDLKDCLLIIYLSYCIYYWVLIATSTGHLNWLL